MTEIEFVDAPPPMRGKGTSAAAFVDALKQNPGKWAVYPTSGSGTRGYLQRRYGLETTSRTVDGNTVLYVRWNGEAA